MDGWVGGWMDGWMDGQYQMLEESSIGHHFWLWIQTPESLCHRNEGTKVDDSWYTCTNVWFV